MIVIKSKIVILGAGHVGSHVARALAARQVAREIVLVDKAREKAEAQAMDISDALTFPPTPVLLRAGGYPDCADADITIVAIGKPREKGQTRLDLMGDSTLMAREAAAQMRAHGVGGLVITITNPCDIIAERMREELGMNRFRAFSTGTLLDTARLIRVLSEQSGLPRSAIDAFVLGEHGDSSMIPFSAVRMDGRPAWEIKGFDPEYALRRTHEIGMDIIEGKLSTEFGIGQAAAYLCRAILTDSGEILPLSVRLEGEYGLDGIPCGVPCRVGREGIREIIELPMTEEERQALLRSASVLETHARLAADIAAKG